MSPLFGPFPYGSGLFGTLLDSSTPGSGDLVVFDGFSLSDGIIVHCSNLIDSGPTRDLVGGPTPRADGQYLTADYFRNKTIEVRGIVRGTDAATLDANLDIVRAALRRREGNLDITRHGVTRRFIATLVNHDELFSNREGYHITFCPFVARFECKTPFGQDIDYTAVDTSIGTSPFNQDVQNLGTIEALPIVYLNFDSASSVTAANFKNLTTGEEVQFTGDLVAGDVIIFDSEATEVTLNGEPVLFEGSLPTLDVGGNLLSITVTGASFSITTTVKFRNRYL